jgi:hypothetical protein
MALTNMKNKPKPKGDAEKLFAASMAEQPAPPLYPWGLTLNLEKESLDKLGLTELPKPDTKMRLTAIVEVAGISADATTEGERRSIRLQITDMSLSPIGEGETGEGE